MRKRLFTKHAGILVASITTAIVLTLVFVVPSTVFGINVTMSPTKGDGARYLFGETLMFQGQITLNEGEFQDIQSVVLNLSGNQTITDVLPTAVGTYDLSCPVSGYTLIVTVTHQNVTFVGGYTAGYIGGSPTGSGSIHYSIAFKPPANSVGYFGPNTGQLTVTTSPGGIVNSPMSVFYISPPATPTPTPPGTPVVIKPPPATGAGSVFEPGTPTQLNTPSGGSSLSIPGGFLDEPAQVVMEELGTQNVPPPPAGMRLLRAISINVYDLLGNHQTVVTGVPVTLTISYTDADVASVGGDPSKLVVMRYVESQSKWVTLQTSVDTQRKVLIAKLNTFSTFAVGSSVTLGDINFDGAVNYLDLAMFAASYGSQQGAPSYRRDADLNSDGKVDHLDLGIFATNYGSGR